MTDEDSIEAIARSVVVRLEHAWNTADGQAFGAAFAPDADFVDVRGDVHRGRDAIAGGHQAIFTSIYRGSTVRYELLRARQLADGVLLAHSTGHLIVPGGPLAGEHRAVQSLTLARGADGWQVVAFHNTPVAPARPA